MNVATWSIRNPIPSVLLFILLSLAGFWGFARLPIQDLPDLDLPAVTVTLSQPGAAPAQLETEVARKVEDALATLSGLKHIRTAITDGRVSIQAEFVLGKPLSDALIETKNAVDRVRSDLPSDLQQPTVAAVTFGSGPVMTYAISSARLDEEALSWFVDDTLSKAVLDVPGVDRLDRVGGVQREIRVEVDPVRLAALGITAADLSRALREVQQQSSGGRSQLGGAEQSIRTVALAAHAFDLAALPIALPGGRHVRLDEVAVVRDTDAERTQAALLDGRPAVGFHVYRAKGYDETKMAEGVSAALARLQAADPSLQIQPVSSSVVYTLEQFDGSMAMLYEGALLAIVVVFLFLRDWRATLIAAAALPLSILPAFAAMYWLGYSLNTLTLLALAATVGILVDDAIVEIENIERHRRAGKSVPNAVKDAVTEIALAVMATTLALVVVFLPTAFMGGVPGLLFRQFGWTAVIAVLASLLVARLLTPMMAAHLLKGHLRKENADGPFMSRYLDTVRWCLDHRKTTAAAAGVFLLASIALVPLIPMGFIPASDSDYTMLSVELPPGSSLDRTLRVAEQAREAVQGVDGIQSVFTTVGQPLSGDSGVQAGEVRRASLTLIFPPRGKRPRQAEIEAQVRAKLESVAGARFTLGNAGGPGNNLQLILASDNSRALKATAQAFERELRGVAGLSNITTTASLERPEIVVHPDLQRAAERGVTAAAIGDVLRIATSGDFDANVARLNLDNRQIYIRLRLPDEARQDLDVIAGMRVTGRDGAVPLASVASLSLSSGPSQIDRYDRRRQVTVQADLGGTPLGEALAATMALPAVLGMPSSVELIESGDAEMVDELAMGFGMALLIGVLCIFCVLVLLFKDFLQPVTILSAIPLSVGGAFLALLVARSELGVPAMIGLVMLMGIVTKNSILLVEYAVVGMTERGLSRRDALIDACHKRARPILMTTVAMIAGMLPIALGLGADASFRQPMAIAVIGGLISSTVLSLLVVPVVFTWLDTLHISHGVGRTNDERLLL